MKNLLVFLTLMLIAPSLPTGQEFRVPKDYKLEKKSDYVKYEKDIVACVNYLENTPLNDKSALSAAAKVFLLKWITGTPTVTITVKSYINDITEKNPGLILIFFGGWARHAIQQPKKVTDLSGNLAGLESLLKVYRSGKGVKKDQKIEKLIKLQKRGELVAWLKEKIKQE